MKIKTLFTTIVLGTALFAPLAACDKGGEEQAKADGDKKDGDKADGDKKDADKADGDKADGDKVAAAGDGDGDAAAGDGDMDPKVKKAADLANAISAEPDRADEILEEAGVDREELDKMMYEIATDPELAAAYKDARLTTTG